MDLDRIKAEVLKLHKGLNHCSIPDLVRLLKHAGALPEAIEEARNTRCPTCAEHTRPVPRRRAMVPDDALPFQIVAMDVVENNLFHSCSPDNTTVTMDLKRQKRQDLQRQNKQSSSPR